MILENINSNIIDDIKYKITKIKEKENEVIIYLDNNEKIYLSIENYFKYRLCSNKGLDEKTYNILKDEEKVFLAYRKVIRKLSIKDYSIKQINDFLKKNSDINGLEINNIIDKLISYGLLDDDKYCQNRVNYLNKQLFSNRQIKMKLKKDGVSGDLIDKYVINSYEDEYEKVSKLVEKYSRIIKNKPINAIKQSIISKIVNAGYGYDIVKDAIENIDIECKNESELLNKEYLKAKNRYEKKYCDYELKKHVYSHLLSKGFRSEDIKKVMEE